MVVNSPPRKTSNADHWIPRTVPLASGLNAVACAVTGSIAAMLLRPKPEIVEKAPPT
jgi:hypothetical protein